MNSKIIKYVHYLLLLLFLISGQCAEEIAEKEEEIALDVKKENSVTTPSLSQTKFEMEVGNSVTIDIDNAKDALDRDIPPKLASISSDLIDASLSNNKLTIKGLKAGTIDITVQWTAESTKVKKDDNGDGIDDNITYKEKTEEATLSITINPASVVNTPSLGSPIENNYSGELNEVINIYLPKAKDKLNNDVAPSIGTYSSLLQAGSTIGSDDTLRVKFIKSGKDALEIQWISKDLVETDNGLKTQYKSDTLKIDINIQTENAGPSAPSLSSPSNGATKVATSTKLVWAASTDPEGDAVTYDVYWGTANPPTTKVSTQSSTEYSPTHKINTTYYWRVVAKDNQNEISSATHSYTTISNNLPTKPLLISPSIGSKDVESDSTLKWQAASDIDNDNITYDVYLGTDNPPTTKVSTGQSGVEYKMNGIKSKTLHYWKIIAKDSKGGETGSDVWSFTSGNFSPSVATIISPVDQATKISENTPLKWNASTDPENDNITYDVYLGTNNPPTTKVSSDQTATEYTPTGQTNATTYYWQIISKDDKGGSTTGQVWSYTTTNALPTKPTLTSPPNSGSSIAATTKLVWNASTDPDGDDITYDVYLGTDASPTNKVSEGQSETEYTPSGLSLGTAHYWKVVANDGNGGLTESDVWSYTTNAAPSKPTISSPSSGVGGIAKNTKLIWNVSTDADNDNVTYDVYLGIDNPPTSKVSSGQSTTEYTPSGQTDGTAYYWYVVAKDTKGAETSSDTSSYATPCPSSLTHSGKTYAVVGVGTQCWMAESLNDDAHTDGESYCYDDDDANCTQYGRMYDLLAAQEIANKISGWRLPLGKEFEQLKASLGANGGTKAKVGGSSGLEIKLGGEVGNFNDQTHRYETSLNEGQVGQLLGEGNTQWSSQFKVTKDGSDITVTPDSQIPIIPMYVRLIKD